MAYFFRLLCISLGYHICFFFMCVSLSQTSVYRPEQMPLFVSFCQHLVPDFASLMFCQHVIGQSLSPASFLNLSIKNCRTIIYLTCIFLLTNKIYCEYSEGLEKLLFLATILYVVKTKMTFKKHNITYVIFFTFQRHERCFTCN